MFERYTEKARRVIFFARFEAAHYGSPYIETEHFLLGLLREDKNVNRFVGSHAAVESIRLQIEAHSTIRPKLSTSADVPLSRECKRILAFGAEEASRLGHRHIGPEHLLMGLMSEQQCFAAALLQERGIELSALRAQLTGDQPPPQPSPTPRNASPFRFKRFSETAMRAALFAIEEASELGSPAIEPEHLLLGVLRVNRMEVARLLRTNEALEEVRREIEEHRQPQPQIPVGEDRVLSRDYQRVLTYASREAERMGHKNVDDGHLLLGILHQEGSLAVKILHARGLTFSQVSVELMGGSPDAGA